MPTAGKGAWALSQVRPPNLLAACGIVLSTALLMKQIVVQHGGEINVDSEWGRGTRVSIRLPLEHTLPVAA